MKILLRLSFLGSADCGYQVQPNGESVQQKLNEAAKKKGGSLKRMDEPKKIDGGFVLVYGGVEENCTFRAMFAGKKDELADQVHTMLFL